MNYVKYIEDKDNGRYIFGTATVGERGQIVIPARARKIFDIKPGDGLIVIGDKRRGLALLRAQDILDIPLPDGINQTEEA